MQFQPNGHLQDEDFSSWLSYPVDDYCSEILSQLAGEEEMKNSEEELSKPVVNFSIFSRAIMESTSKNHEAGAGSSSMCSKNEPRVRCREENEEDRAEVQEEGESLERRPPKRQALDKKRTRTSQIHNMSERRRRDRINEKMRALQELVPSCNKADKASMLDEVIEYLKTLQMQVQVMSMGFMHPMMLQSGIPMNMGIGMGMVDVSRIPTSSFPSVNGINGNHPGIPMMMQGTTMSSPVMPIPMMYSSHFMATRLAQTSSGTTMVSLEDSLHSSEMCSKKSRADACENV